MFSPVTLNEAEIRLAEYLARRRFQSNRSNGVNDRKIGPQSNRMVDLNGIGGELAFCKMMNVYPDLEISVRSGSADLSIFVYDVDVKTSEYASARLLAPLHATADKADAYVLMVGVMPTYQFKGWAWATDLILEERIVDLGHGPGYGLLQSELTLEIGELVR